MNEKGKNPRDIKVGLKNRVMAMLNLCPKGIECEKLTAMLELETGFSEKMIQHTLKNMECVELIAIDGGIASVKMLDVKK